MSPATEKMSCLAALLAVCSTLAPTSYTLHSTLAVAPSSRLQYLALCDSGGYYHPNS
jgi:hypothetical protein